MRPIPLKDAVDIDVIHRAVKNAIEATYEEYKLDSNVTNFQNYFERECNLKVVKDYSKKRKYGFAPPNGCTRYWAQLKFNHEKSLVFFCLKWV
jgi:phosphatidylethanolamine-binding protein (PEBP) family uncharacterized protein